MNIHNHEKHTHLKKHHGISLQKKKKGYPSSQANNVFTFSNLLDKVDSFLSILFGRHVQKDYNVKQIMYDMINFYFELAGTFPIVKNNCLQHYVNVFNINIC